jgi:transcription elongation GreA/GreB family factor
MDSPVGRSLLSREVGDEVTVQRPKGQVTAEIIGVRNTPKER